MLQDPTVGHSVILSNTDDGNITMPLGFSVNFFDLEVSEVLVSVNGWIGYGPADPWDAVPGAFQV